MKNYLKYILIGSCLCSFSFFSPAEQIQYCNEGYQFCINVATEFEAKDISLSEEEGLLFEAVCKGSVLKVFGADFKPAISDIELHQLKIDQLCIKEHERVVSQVTTHKDNCFQSTIKTNTRGIELRSYRQDDRFILLLLETEIKQLNRKDNYWQSMDRCIELTIH